MRTITYLIVLLCSCLFTWNYVQYRMKADAAKMNITAKSIEGQKMNGNESFYPLVFGSGFMIVDESLVHYELE